MLENGADLCVNERQKIRHYRARSTEKRRRRRRNSDFFTLRGAYVKLRYIALIGLEISRRTRWWCLKCVIVYLARAIQAFVMYCVNGTSRSSLLIESTDSMIILIILLASLLQKSRVILSRNIFIITYSKST